MHGQQDQGLVGLQQRQQTQDHDRQVDRQGVAEGPLQIRLDAPPHGHRLHQGCEGIVKKHQIGRLPGHSGAAGTHGHPDIGSPQGGRIVDTIAGHRHHGTASLQRPHQPQLLLRPHPRKY